MIQSMGCCFFYWLAFLMRLVSRLYEIISQEGCGESFYFIFCELTVRLDQSCSLDATYFSYYICLLMFAEYYSKLIDFCDVLTGESVGRAQRILISYFYEFLFDYLSFSLIILPLLGKLCLDFGLVSCRSFFLCNL